MKYYFDAIFTSNEAGHSKDKPATFRKAIKHFGINCSETVVFEDVMLAVQTTQKVLRELLYLITAKIDKLKSTICRIATLRILNT